MGRKGRFADAAAEFSEAVRLAPGFKEAHKNLAVALENQGKLDDALIHASDTLRLDPNYAAAHKTIGTVLAKKGRLDEAIAQFAEVLKLQPGAPDGDHTNGGRAPFPGTRTGQAEAPRRRHPASQRSSPTEARIGAGAQRSRQYAG